MFAFSSGIVVFSCGSALNSPSCEGEPNCEMLNTGFEALGLSWAPQLSQQSQVESTPNMVFFRLTCFCIEVYREELRNDLPAARKELGEHDKRRLSFRLPTPVESLCLGGGHSIFPVLSCPQSPETDGLWLFCPDQRPARLPQIQIAFKAYCSAACTRYGGLLKCEPLCNCSGFVVASSLAAEVFGFGACARSQVQNSVR